MSVDLVIVDTLLWWATCSLHASAVVCFFIALISSWACDWFFALLALAAVSGAAVVEADGSKLLVVVTSWWDA